MHEYPYLLKGKMSKKNFFSRERLIPAFKVLLAVAIISILILNTSVSQIMEIWGKVSPIWLLIALFLFVLVNLAKAFQYHLLMYDKLPYSKVLNVTLIQNVVSNLLATGAGVASFFALLTAEHGVKASRTLGVFLLIKMGDLIQIWLFLLFSTWIVWDQVVFLRSFLTAALALIAAGIGLFFAAIFLRQKFLAVFRAFLAALRLDRISPLVRLMNALESLISSDNQFVVNSLRRAVFGAFIYLLANLVWTFSITRALNFDIGLVPIIFVSMIQQLISYLPIQIFGGLGVSDLSAVYLFSFFEYETALLIPIMLGWRILYYIMNIGVFVYLLLAGVWGREKRPATRL